MKKRILIIDDDPELRRLLVLYLESEGFQVNCAVDGLKGLELLKTIPAPDLILVDQRMPNMSGEEFIEILVVDEKLKEIPVVLLSADSDVFKSDTVKKAAGWLKKPFEIDNLIESVRHYSSLK